MSQPVLCLGQVDLSPLLDRPDHARASPLSPAAQSEMLTVELDADGMPLTAGNTPQAALWALGHINSARSPSTLCPAIHML